MKSVILLLSLLLLTILTFMIVCLANQYSQVLSKTGDVIAFETISKSHYSGYHGEAKNCIAITHKEWESLWNIVCANILPKPVPAPNIDFTQEMILAVFQGSKATGGYSIEITKLIETENKLEVFVEEVSPGDLGVIQVLTQPYHIIKIHKTNKEVIFNKEEKIELDLSAMLKLEKGKFLTMIMVW